MRRERESEYEVMERRAKISEIIFHTPMTKNEIAERTGFPNYIIGDDLNVLSKKYGIAYFQGRKDIMTDIGKRTAPIWRCREILKVEIPAKEERQASRVKPGELPSLPALVLFWMGYTDHKPEGGRIINNENFHQPTQPSRVKVSIGNHWGIMMEASQ